MQRRALHSAARLEPALRERLGSWSAFRWIKARDKPNEETFELPPYGVEVRQTLPDDDESQEQLKHANEQLALSRAYSGPERK
jgi:hypothetical protein